MHYHRCVPEFPIKKTCLLEPVAEKVARDGQESTLHFFGKGGCILFGGLQYGSEPSLIVFCHLTTHTPAWSNAGQMWLGRM